MNILANKQFFLSYVWVEIHNNSAFNPDFLKLHLKECQTEILDKSASELRIWCIYFYDYANKELIIILKKIMYSKNVLVMNTQSIFALFQPYR